MRIIIQVFDGPHRAAMAVDPVVWAALLDPRSQDAHLGSLVRQAVDTMRRDPDAPEEP